MAAWTLTQCFSMTARSESRKEMLHPLHLNTPEPEWKMKKNIGPHVMSQAGLLVKEIQSLPRNEQSFLKRRAPRAQAQAMLNGVGFEFPYMRCSRYRVRKYAIARAYRVGLVV